MDRTCLALCAFALGVAGTCAAPRAQAEALPPSPFATARYSVATGSGGVPINVVETGNPTLPAILLIHGFRQSYLAWSLQFASDLPTRCHLVAFDLRGHGNSGQPWDAAAYDHGQPWADDVASVIKATGLSRPLIVGWSYGGNVAMDFARLHPEMPVAGYVLVTTAAGMIKVPTPPPATPPRPTMVPDLSANIRAVDASAALLFAPTVPPALREQFRAAAMRVSPFVDRGIARRAGETNADMVNLVHSPVMLVFGGKDPIVSPPLAQQVAAAFPGATRVDFAEAGHVPFLEDAARFNALLDAAQCRSAAALPEVPAAPAEPAVRTITHEQIEAKYATPQSRFAMIDGVRIHYQDQGSGPAILLIHGSLGDTHDWDGWVNGLVPHYRVIRLDLPGFGLSGEIANGNYSIDRSLSLIDGLMDSLGIERFAIAGVSYGGPVAFRYAATRVERTSALILINSAGVEPGKQPVDAKTGAKVFYSTISASAPVTRDYVAKGLARSFNNPALISPEMIQRKLDALNVIDRDREGAAMVAQYVRGDPEQVLAHIRAPTLVLWGAAERSLSLSTADRIVASLTHARSVRKVIIPGGDHAMHIELAGVTAQVASDFLDHSLTGAKR